MIDLDILKRKGCSAADLKPIFEKFENEHVALTTPNPVTPATAENPDKRTDEQKRMDRIANLRNRVRSRIQNGRDWNFSNYRVFHALDIAWNTPFKQINPTLLMSLAGQGSDAVLDKLKAWDFDLTKVIVGGTKNPQTGVVSGGTVNVPAFFQIFVPLVRAYVTIRWAKIVNDRRLIPFFKYEPAVATKKNRVRCEVLTNRIEVMSRQMGYFEVMKQSVFQMVHYGFCLKFPKEQWWTESQLSDNSGTGTSTQDQSEAGLVPTPDMEATATVSTGDSEEASVIVKEGIRYHMPHPARTFWDQGHRISTFNSDTGCEYAGYWRVLRYREIAGNKNFWCTDKIGFGNNDWWGAAGMDAYWKTVFKGCVMNWPSATSGGETAGNQDREAKIGNNYYNHAEYGDMSCTLTEYFEKLIPSEWGLGEYHHPVWFRFVVAGDTATIIYAAPLPYAPVVAYVYDSDENRDINASLSLEVLPFQDQFSNLMTQYLLTVQRNLDNATFIDKDQVDTDDIDKLENAGERLWRSRTFIRYSGRKNMRAQTAIPQAVYNAQFQQLDSQSIVQAMKVLLDTLERVLVMSSQEMAQAASHEQTKEEVQHIAQNTSSRFTFTQTPVDLATEAWKQQIYKGEMAYGDPNFYSYVAYDRTITPEFLKDLGFTTLEEDDKDMPNRRVYVTGKKKNLRETKDTRTAMMLEAFAAMRDGNDRINDAENAGALMQFLMSSVNTEYGVTIGGDQYIDILNMVGRRTGLFDKEFKLVCKFDPTEVMKKKMAMEAEGGGAKGAGGGAQANPAEQIVPMLQMLQEQIMKDVGQSIKPLADTVMKTVEGLRALGEMLDQQIVPAIKQNSADIQSLGAAIKSIEEFVHSIPPQQPVAPPLTPAVPMG